MDVFIFDSWGEHFITEYSHLKLYITIPRPYTFVALAIKCGISFHYSTGRGWLRTFFFPFLLFMCLWIFTPRICVRWWHRKSSGKSRRRCKIFIILKASDFVDVVLWFPALAKATFVCIAPHTSVVSHSELWNILATKNIFGVLNFNVTKRTFLVEAIVNLFINNIV